MKDYGFIHKYPYTNFHELNLDYILQQVGRIAEENGVNTTDIQKLKEESEKFEDFYNALMSGDYPEEFKISLIEWIQNNAIDIFGGLIKFVFFGLTDDGYFVAYIPESWDDIQFGTTEYDDYPENYNEYGHLTLTY